MKKRIKFNGFLIAAAAALVLFFPGIFLRRDDTALSGQAARIAGALLILAGQLLRVSARGYKAENSANGRLLVESGPYALVRNPMYLGIFLIGLGLGCALFQYWAICLFLAIFAVRYVRLIFSEEKKLLVIFGNSFVDYCKKVPRFFPSPKKLRGKEIRGYLPLKRAWFVKEIGSIIAVLSAAFLAGWWGAIRK